MDNVILADYTPISDTIHHPYSIEEEEIKNNNIISNDKIIMKNCRKYCPIIRKGLDLQGKNMVYDPSVYLKKYEKNINYR